MHKSRDAIANSEAGEMVRRYIRLTYLIPELLTLVDETVLKTNKNGLTMGIKPADKKIGFDILEGILNEKKGNQNDKISFNKEKIENVLPLEIKQRDKRYVEQYIINAIIEYNKLNKNEEENIIVQDLIF